MLFSRLGAARGCWVVVDSPQPPPCQTNNQPSSVVAHYHRTSESDGSAYVEMGNTKVLVTVNGPREAVVRSRIRHDSAFVQCSFGVASFATGERRRRGRADRRLAEYAQLVEQTVEATAQLHLFPRAQVSSLSAKPSNSKTDLFFFFFFFFFLCYFLPFFL